MTRGFDALPAIMRFHMLEISPSKIGELGAIGMPMVIPTAAGTTTARYVPDFRTGELLTERERRPARLCEIITSVDKRTRLSASAANMLSAILSRSRQVSTRNFGRAQIGCVRLAHSGIVILSKRTNGRENCARRVS